MKRALLFLLIAGALIAILVICIPQREGSRADSPARQKQAVPRAVITPPRRPAPHFTDNPAPPEAVVETTNHMAHLVRGEELPKLSREQIDGFLAANGRSAGSLLAVFRVTGDKAWLREASEKHPTDPRVDFAAIAASENPEERREWVDAFKKSAPDNALANYLSARDYFKAGNSDEALQDLERAQGKSKYTDYSSDFIQNTEEAFLAAGYSEAEAKAGASSSLLLPQFAELKQLGRNLVDLAGLYRQSSDETSAQAVLQMGMSLSQRVGSGQGSLLGDLVGMAIENQMLGAMDPGSSFGSGSQTIKERLDELAQQRATIQGLAQQAEGLIATLSQGDLANYFERRNLMGEQQAMQWLVDKYGKK